MCLAVDILLANYIFNTRKNPLSWILVHFISKRSYFRFVLRLETSSKHWKVISQDVIFPSQHYVLVL